MSYRCSLSSPLQKRSKDYKGLGVSESFELLSFLGLWQEVSQISQKLLAKVEEILQNFYAILCNPWISSAMTMAMSIYRTLCVLVYFPLWFILLSVQLQMVASDKWKFSVNHKLIKGKTNLTIAAILTFWTRSCLLSDVQLFVYFYLAPAHISSGY